MYLRQNTTVGMTTEKALRDLIKDLAQNPELKDVNAEVLTRAMITHIVKLTDINDIKTLIELHRQDETGGAVSSSEPK